jgi:hypothetical protein
VHVLQEHLHPNKVKHVRHVNLLVYSVLQLQPIAKDASLTCMHIVVNALLHVRMVHLNQGKIVNHVNSHASAVLTRSHVINVLVDIYYI